MDIENLIERLKYYGTTYAIGDNLGKEIDGSDELMLNAATALSTLQAENDMLRTELEKAKRERDAAIEDLEEIMFKGGYNIDTCHFCTNGQCYGRGGTQCCEPKWRSQKED